MSKKIYNDDDYYKQFDINCVNNTNCSISTDTKAFKAYQFACDTRKFEIELYWKRSSLFWTFVGAAFTGYIALLALEIERLKLLLLIAILGWVFSIAWYFACRGSKFWQQNWEMHIDMLENYFTGPIYKINKNAKECKLFNFLDSYQISVSKVNMLLALEIAAIWLVLIFYSLQRICNYKILNIIYEYISKECFLLGLSVVIVLMSLFIIVRCTTTKIKNDPYKFIYREP